MENVYFLNSDGTVVDMDVPIEIAQRATDMDLAKAQIEDWMAAQGVCILWAGNLESEDIQRVNKVGIYSAAAAVGDVYFYNRYGHPLTTVGFHLLANKTDLASPYQEDIGVVHSTYQGSQITLDDRIRNGLPQWRQVNHVSGQLFDSAIPQKRVKDKALKHAFVDAMIAGKAMRVWIAPIRPYVASLAVQWLCGDLTKAAEYRSRLFKRSKVRKTVIRPAGTEAWRAIESANKADEGYELPEDLYVQTRGEELWDLMMVEGTPQVQIYLGGEPMQRLRWEPENPTRIKHFQNLIEADDFRMELV